GGATRVRRAHARRARLAYAAAIAGSRRLGPAGAGAAIGARGIKQARARPRGAGSGSAARRDRLCRAPAGAAETAPTKASGALVVRRARRAGGLLRHARATLAERGRDAVGVGGATLLARDRAADVGAARRRRAALAAPEPVARFRRGLHAPCAR